MNPANFFALNPEVLEATVDEKGENLVRGLKMMLADLERGKGKLLIRQTDMDAFEVGRNTAVSPGRGGLPERPDAADPVRAADREGLRQAAADHPALDQQVLHPRPQPEEEHGEVAGRAGPHRLHDLLGEPRRSGTGRRPGRTTCSRAGSPPSTRCWRRPGRRACTSRRYCVGGTMAGTLMAWLGKTSDKRVASRDLLHRAARLRGRGRAADLRRRAHPRGGRRGHGEGLHARRPDGERLQHAAGERPDLGLHGQRTTCSARTRSRSTCSTGTPNSTAMPARAHRFYLEEFYIRERLRQGRAHGAATRRSRSPTSRGRSTTWRPRRTTSRRPPRSIAAPRR